MSVIVEGFSRRVFPPQRPLGLERRNPKEENKTYLFLLVSQTSRCAEKPYFPLDAALHSASITRRSLAGIAFTSEK